MLEGRGLSKPGLDQVKSADLRIWADVPSAVLLSPRGETPGRGEQQSWQTSGEEVYFQRSVLSIRLLC